MVNNRARQETIWIAPKTFQNLLRRLAPLTFLIRVQAFRDPLRGELPHFQIFMTFFFCNSWALFPLTIYTRLYIGAIPYSHILEWLCPHEGRVYGEDIFCLIVLPGIRAVYLRPIHSAAVIYPCRLSIRSPRADIPLPTLGRGQVCPIPCGGGSFMNTLR
jgi:hypothetical protein